MPKAPLVAVAEAVSWAVACGAAVVGREAPGGARPPETLEATTASDAAVLPEVPGLRDTPELGDALAAPAPPAALAGDQADDDPVAVVGALGDRAAGTA